MKPVAKPTVQTATKRATTKASSKKWQTVFRVFKQLKKGIVWLGRRIARKRKLWRWWRRFRIGEGARRKHTFLPAGTGAWKSELLKSMIWQHIIYDRTAIIAIDPNGDFAEQVAKFKEHASGTRSQKLIYIEPSLSTTDFPVINPLDLPNVWTETLDKVTQQMHKTLVQSGVVCPLRIKGKVR